MKSLAIRILFLSTFLIAFCYCEIEDAENIEVETETPIEIAAIGRVSTLGELYDARSDQFIRLSLFNNPLQNSSITTTSNRETKLKYTLVDSIIEKFRVIDVSAELKLNILFGVISVQGSGRYLQDTKKSAKSAKASLIQSFSTVYEKITITDKNLKTLVNMDLLGPIDYATHVVVGIQWGGKVLISVEDSNYEDEDKQKIEGNLGIKMKSIFGLIGGSGEGKLNISDSNRTEINKFNFEIYGDILPNSVPTSVVQAIEFMKEVPSLIKEANNGKGKEMTYTLIPINLLRKLWKINISTNTILRRIEEETIQKCVELFDNMNLIEQRLNDLVEDVKRFELYIETSKVEKIKNLQLNYSLYQARLRENLSEKLLSVRSGNETVDKLEEVIFKSTSDPLSWKNVDTKIDEFGQLQSEISFIKMMIKLNVILLDKNQQFQQFLWDNFNKDIYILFYNYNQTNNLNKYMNQFRIMLEERHQYGPAALFASANFEISRKDETILSNDTKISLFRNGTCYMDKYELGHKTNNDSNPQTWSLFDIQNKLSGQIKEISGLKEQLNNHESTINKHESTIGTQQLTINDLIKNPIPINFIYVQLSSQPEPKSLWPTVEWKDVTSEYSGLFFRAEGGDSASFGTIQKENTLRVIEIRNTCSKEDHTNGVTLEPNSWSDWVPTAGWMGKWCYLNFLTSGGEVRPRNMAIRIWKRTG